MGVYLPVYWLYNPNVHRLLKPGHMPTPALPKRLSLIFLWEEFSQTDPIQIVNPLLDTVCIIGGRWCAHSYFYLPKNNKEADCFLNRLLSLC